MSNRSPSLLSRFALLAMLSLFGTAPALADDGGGPSDWSGLYVGGQAGYGWGRTELDYFFAHTTRPKSHPEGFIGGGHVGYNWQDQNFVTGLVGDINYADLDDVNAASGATAGTVSEIGLNGSIRAIVGAAVNRFLFYGTGGIAVADFDHTVLGGATNPQPSETYFGLTIGAGIKMAVTEAISGFVEYRYSNYMPENYVAVPRFGAHRLHLEHQQVQAGFSINLGSLFNAGQ